MHDHRPDFCHRVRHHPECECEVCIQLRIDRKLTRVVHLLEAKLSQEEAAKLLELDLKLKKSADALSAAVQSQSVHPPKL